MQLEKETYIFLLSFLNFWVVNIFESHEVFKSGG